MKRNFDDTQNTINKVIITNNNDVISKSILENLVNEKDKEINNYIGLFNTSQYKIIEQNNTIENLKSKMYDQYQIIQTNSSYINKLESELKKLKSDLFDFSESANENNKYIKHLQSDIKECNLKLSDKDKIIDKDNKYIKNLELDIKDLKLELYNKNEQINDKYKEINNKLEFLNDVEKHIYKLYNISYPGSTINTKLCKFHLQNKCLQKNCTFAHGINELAIEYKLFFCKHGSECREQNHCSYVHSEKEWLHYNNYNDYNVNKLLNTCHNIKQEIKNENQQ